MFIICLLALCASYVMSGVKENIIYLIYTSVMIILFYLNDILTELKKRK